MFNSLPEGVSGVVRCRSLKKTIVAFSNDSTQGRPAKQRYPIVSISKIPAAIRRPTPAHRTNRARYARIGRTAALLVSNMMGQAQRQSLFKPTVGERDSSYFGR